MIQLSTVVIRISSGKRQACPHIVVRQSPFRCSISTILDPDMHRPGMRKRLYQHVKCAFSSRDIHLFTV